MASSTKTVTETKTGEVSEARLSADESCIRSPIVNTVKEPFDVPWEMHAENRARLVSMFKALPATALPDTPADAPAAAAPPKTPFPPVPANSVIVLEGGTNPMRHSSDHEPIFRQESHFHYLFGVIEPDCYATLDVDSGKATLYVPRLPEEYAIWMGKILSPEDFKGIYKVDEVRYADELDKDLAEKGTEHIYTLHGRNSDSGNEIAPVKFDGIDKYKQDDKKRLFHAITECRVIKTKREQELLRYVNRISSEAHMAVMNHARPGLKEYQLESMFRHWCYYYGGARLLSYTCICASGGNSATLHYGHAAAPNDRTLKDGDICLFDMGCEYKCYSSDITCSFPSNGKFTEDQVMIYEAVLAAQIAVMKALKPGVAWADMHSLAYRTILTHLREGGLVKGDIDEMIEADIGAVFMAHGLGHFIGIDTHDTGGYTEDMERIPKPGYRSLRTLRVMEEGMFITVEPGCYFVDYVIDKALANPDQAKFLNADVIARFRGWGGVRLEDDVLITKDGVENFTVCPRTVADVEAVMAGKLTRADEVTRIP